MQARKEAAEERREAAKAKHEEAHAKYVAAMQARKEAAEERHEAAKAKREEAHQRYVAAMQARKEAAEARREAKRHKSEDVAPAQDDAPVSSSFDSGAIASAGAPAAGSGGTLRINSLPWAEVYVDGRKVGNTPQRALSVAPGEHDVRLVNNAFDMVASFHVRVSKGQSITRGVMLEER
jgi:hypothetical protein